MGDGRRRRGDGRRLINHSCEPNLSIRPIRGHILYVSGRAIRRGEELTVDYKFSNDFAEGRLPLRFKEMPRDDQRLSSSLG